MNEIVRSHQVQTMDEIEKAARAMAASGYFKDSNAVAQAVVKILAGRELGFGAFSSMTGVNIIQGKPAISANLMASTIKRSGKYNYRIVEHTDTRCSIDFFENSEKIGTSTYTLDDAKKAGIANNQNWTKYPKNMLFARAISNGVRWHCPDVMNGSVVYTPDEVGMTVDDEGNGVVIDAQTEQLKPTKSLEIAARYNALVAKATALGIDTKAFVRGANTPDEELLKLGVELNAIVKGVAA